MKHLKLFEMKNLIEKSKLVIELLDNILPSDGEEFQILRNHELDSDFFLLIEFYGNLNNSTYYKFDQIITILNKLEIKWEFSIGGGYIEISFEDESKINKLIEDLKTIIESRKYNL